MEYVVTLILSLALGTALSLVGFMLLLGIAQRERERRSRRD